MWHRGVWAAVLIMRRPSSIWYRSAMLVWLLAAAAPVSAQTAVQPAAWAIAPEQRAAFEQIIREYLLNHPHIINEAQQILQVRSEMERGERAKAALLAQRDALERDSSAPVAGNPQGDVTVVEFFDYACGYCKRAAPALEALKAADANVRVVYKEFPILGPGSVTAARAALAAQRQGKYAAMHQALMKAESMDDAAVRAAAVAAGLDWARLSADMETPEIMQMIVRNQELATALAIGGTPAFVVGERLVPGAVSTEALAALVAEERERIKQARSAGTPAKP